MKYNFLGEEGNLPLLRIIEKFPRKNKLKAPASGEKLRGIRGRAPKVKKLPCTESSFNCNCNRCRLSLQALPTKRR